MTTKAYYEARNFYDDWIDRDGKRRKGGRRGRGRGGRGRLGRLGRRAAGAGRTVLPGAATTASQALLEVVLRMH